MKKLQACVLFLFLSACSEDHVDRPVIIGDFENKNLERINYEPHFLVEKKPNEIFPSRLLVGEFDVDIDNDGTYDLFFSSFSGVTCPLAVNCGTEGIKIRGLKLGISKGKLIVGTEVNHDLDWNGPVLFSSFLSYRKLNGEQYNEYDDWTYLGLQLKQSGAVKYGWIHFRIDQISSLMIKEIVIQKQAG